MKDKFILLCLIINVLYAQNSIDNYLLDNNNFTIIGNFNDGIEKPRDLDFHPTIDNQLWVLNQGEDTYMNNTENIFSICLPENSELNFTIYDSNDNGICCENGEGSYLLTSCENIFIQGSEFGSFESTSFSFGDGCQNSCEDGEFELNIIINTDSRAKETSWLLIDSYSSELYARRLEPGGSTVIFHDVGLSLQDSEYRKDSYSRHFMHTASALSFDDSGFFANTLECQDANNNENGFFTGPTLWDSDLSIYAAVNQNGPLLGSHLDMIHQSPFSMGIEYAGIGNVYWVFDGYHSSIVRYDFAMPHIVGGHDHSDGRVWRFDEVDILREEGVPSHMVLDDSTGFLYIADTGNQRILRFNVNSGSYSSDLVSYGESLEEHILMENAEWEVLIDNNLEKPSGIDLYYDRLIVSDYSTGHIIIYDISENEPIRLGHIDTGYENNVMGVKIGPNQKIWYVNYELNNIVRIDYNLLMGDVNNDGGINVLDVVSLVYFILNAEILELPSADLNSDGNINVLDVVQLVELILN